MNLYCELCYLVGALKDGCLSSEWAIIYIQKCKEWLSSVILPKLNKVFDLELRQSRIKWQSAAWKIRFRNKRVWLALDELRNLLPKTKEAQRAYIQGFWDAEGGCPRHPDINKPLYISFTQKDKKSLEELKDMLNNTFRIRTGRVRLSDKKKEVWRLCVENQLGMLKFCEEIGSLHPEKKLRLKKLKQILKAKLRQRNSYRISSQELQFQKL